MVTGPISQLDIRATNGDSAIMVNSRHVEQTEQLEANLETS